MALAGSGERSNSEDDVKPPAKRLRLDDAALTALHDLSTFDAPPLSPPDEAATLAGEDLTAHADVFEGLEPFCTAGQAQDAGDTLAALHDLLSGYDDNGTPLPVATPQPIGFDFEPNPLTESEQNVLDRLTSILADAPDTPCAVATYPSPVSVSSATPAPSELSFQSRDSSASVEPESAAAASASASGSGVATKGKDEGKGKGKSSERKYWTAEQDAALIAAREDPAKHDWTWKEIAEVLNCGHRSVQCRARYLLLKDKQKIDTAGEDPARPAKIKPQGRSFFTPNDDAIILAHLLGEVWIDWSVVGASLNPPRTGDSCYQRSRKLRKKTIAERRAILQAYNPPSPVPLAGTPAARPTPEFFAAVAPSVNINKPSDGTTSGEANLATVAETTAVEPHSNPSVPLPATGSDIQIDPVLYA
ncbi:hypothetical protein JCM3774_004687 [Rhodotorula dairenensis]